MNEEKKGIWGSPIAQSRIKSPDVKLAEMLFGYFIGPFGAMVGITCADRLYRRRYADFDFLEYLNDLSEKE